MRRRRGCSGRETSVRYLRTADCRRVRIVAGFRRNAVVYRGRVVVLLMMLAVASAVFTAGLFAGYVLGAATTVGLLLVAWLAYALRVMPLLPAGPRGDGPAPPGGAGVREPRRPLPVHPAGAAVAPIDPDEPPGQVVAWV